MIDGLINILILLAILVGLVLVHELGHFVMAKRAGVKVHEFGIGFPPRAAVLFRRGETSYTLNWLPIGGFVRLEGEEGESADSRAFVNQKLRTRLRILFAGVVVNFVLAWVIFTLIALVAQPTWKVRLGEVLPDSPAALAGLVGGQFIEEREFVVEDGSGEPTGEVIPYNVHDDSGELITAIDGVTFPVFADMAQADSEDARIGPIKYLADHPGQTVVLSIERTDGSLEDVEATLRSADEIAQGMGALGFKQGASDFGSAQNGIVDSVVIGFERTVEASTLILRGVASLIGSILDGPGEPLDVAGPIGIVGVVGEVRDALPPVFLIWFVGLLSANLAVINILPFPPMDGGRITMALVQAASRNRVSPAAERMVYLTGFVMLMALLVWVTISDISRLSA
jgi:regulator of sigma E protease